MAKIIPAINSPDFDSVEAQIRIAEEIQPSGGWVHIDVSDGVFTPQVTWNTPEDLARLNTKLSVEVHLMVSNPEEAADAWLRYGAKRVIVHFEAMTDSVLIHETCRTYGAECILAIAPQTDVECLRAHADFTAFQILAVVPGPSGQKFQEKMLEKISFLRANMPNATIEVDGGINDETVSRIVAAGADTLVSASYIFKSDEPKAAYERLRRAANDTRS